jgi:hypothetical protein
LTKQNDYVCWDTSVTLAPATRSLFTNWASCGWQQVARGAVQAVAHGTFQGGMMAVSGGKFWNGFAAGAASSAVGSLWTADLNGARGGLGFFENYRTSSIGMIAFGTVSGGGSSSSSPQITYQPANAYSFASGGGTSAMVTSRSTSPGGGYNSSVEMHPYVPTATIHMPTDHYFLGANMTALSEGNFFQQAIYGAANSFNIVGQYLMGRGVGDSSMRNLNGTATVTNEATLAFGTMPLMLVGGEGAGSSLNGLSSTFSRNSAQLVRNSSWLNKGNWWRLGEGWNPNIGSKNIRLAWGAHPNHLHEVPRWLRPINNWLRNLGNGHKHYPNW